MIIMLSDFVTWNPQSLTETVKMQKVYDEMNSASENLYSKYHWEAYESDDEESKVIAIVPVDLVSFTFELVVVWPSKANAHPLVCPCSPSFCWLEPLFNRPRGVMKGSHSSEEYMWECNLPTWEIG